MIKTYGYENRCESFLVDDEALKQYSETRHFLCFAENKSHAIYRRDNQSYVVESLDKLFIARPLRPCIKRMRSRYSNVKILDTQAKKQFELVWDRFLDDQKKYA